jgi:hypothetical protein
VLWTWLSHLKPYSGFRIDNLFPWLFAASWVLDLFNSQTLDSSPPSKTSTLSLFEAASFAWINPIVFRRGGFEFENLPELKVSTTFDEYQSDFRSACSKDHHRIWPLFWGFILSQHKSSINKAFILRMVEDVSTLGVPLILHNLLNNPSTDCVILLFCSRTIGSLCGNYSSYYIREIAAQYKAMLTSALHEKTLGIKDPSPKIGDISTIAEVDSQMIYRNTLTFLDLWFCPLQIILCLAGLLYLLSWEGLVLVIGVMVRPNIIETLYSLPMLTSNI